MRFFFLFFFSLFFFFLGGGRGRGAMLQLNCPIGIFLKGNSGRFTRGKPAATEGRIAVPNLLCMPSF